jgi:hypothetical protein
MHESRLLARVPPSSPDFLPDVRHIREKYWLPEVVPEGEAIEEFFLGDWPGGLEDFRKDIRGLVPLALTYFRPRVPRCLSMPGRWLANRWMRPGWS